MESFCFLDTNFLVRYLAGDHEQHTPIATRLIESIEAGRLTVDTADTVIFETIFTMTSWYKAERADLADSLGILLSLDGVRLPTKRQVLDALDLWVRFKRLSYADAYHLVLTSSTNHRRIASFDQGLDRCLPGISRIEQLP